MSEQLYRMVELREGQPVQYVGVYVLRWDFERWGYPQVGFVEVTDESEEEIRDEREQSASSRVQ